MLGIAQSLSLVIERMLCLPQAQSEQVREVKGSLGNAEVFFLMEMRMAYREAGEKCIRTKHWKRNFLKLIFFPVLC